MSEIEPHFLLGEQNRWQGKLEEAKRAVEFCERKLGEIASLLSETNVIYVPDEHWQGSRRIER
jgi:hypothetical protein